MTVFSSSPAVGYKSRSAYQVSVYKLAFFHTQFTKPSIRYCLDVCWTDIISRLLYCVVQRMFARAALKKNPNNSRASCLSRWIKWKPSVAKFHKPLSNSPFNRKSGWANIESNFFGELILSGLFYSIASSPSYCIAEVQYDCIQRVNVAGFYHFRVLSTIHTYLCTQGLEPFIVVQSVGLVRHFVQYMPTEVLSDMSKERANRNDRLDRSYPLKSTHDL